VPLPPLSSIRRRWGVLILIVSGVLLLALGDRALGSLVARFTLPTRSAQWIWEPRNRRDLSPAAFYAVRDFTLDRAPARARLLVSGDEEYILSLNGARIGAGGWQPGAPLDVWEVGPLLQPGSNRLLAEVRSDRGAGGFLLSLQTEDGRPLVGTDDAGASSIATSSASCAAGSLSPATTARPASRPRAGDCRRWAAGAGRRSGRSIHCSTI
jgi:hypothetical protein